MFLLNSNRLLVTAKIFSEPHMAGQAAKNRSWHEMIVQVWSLVTELPQRYLRKGWGSQDSLSKLVNGLVFSRGKSWSRRTRSWRMSLMSWGKLLQTKQPRTTHPTIFRTVITCYWTSWNWPMRSWKWGRKKCSSWGHKLWRQPSKRRRGKMW